MGYYRRNRNVKQFNTIIDVVILYKLNNKIIRYFAKIIFK